MNFQSIVSQFFQWQTSCVVRYPLVFLLVPPLITVFVTTMAATDFALNISNETLQVFLPDQMESLMDLRELIRLFPPSDAQRDSYSLLGSKFAYTTVEDTSPNHNIVSSEGIMKLAELHKKILKIKSKSGLTFSSVCLRKTAQDACTLHPLAFALEDSDPVLSAQFMLRYPQLVFGNSSIDNALVFGDVKVRRETVDKLGNAPIASARAVRSVYVLENTDRGEEWLNEFLALMPKTRFVNANIYWSSSKSLAMEMERNGELLIPWMPWMIIVLILLCSLVCCSKDSVRSQPWIGLFAMMNAVLATTTASAFLISIRFPFLPLIAIMPFLVISIGVDNMFLMLKSWRLHSHIGSLERRFVAAITETSASLLLTSLTDGLSFSIGSLSDFYAVRVFCTYCALAILCMFFYQITFFNAAMLLCCRREVAGRHAFFLYKVTPDERASSSSSLTVLETSLPCRKDTPTIGERIATVLHNRYVKMLVFVLYLGYLGGSVNFALKLPLGLDLTLLTPDSSYAALELKAQERLFKDYGTFCFAVVKTQDISLSEPADRRKLLQLYRKLGSSEFASRYQFWVEDFDKFVNSKRLNSRDFMRELMHFLRKPAFEIYGDDIRFTHDGRIEAVKMLFRLRKLSPLSDTPRAEYLRTVLKNSSYTGFAYDTSFLLVDQQSATVRNVVVNVVTATLAMLCICILLVPRLVCSICICVSILSINIGVVGALSAVHTRLDIISMITIVMSIGFSVDYVAHATFHFIIQKEDRLKHCLSVMTEPIIQSALSTAVGVALLAPVPSYIIRTFVYTVVFVVGIGVLHGLVFLPVLLDTIVPMSEYLEPYHADGTMSHHGVVIKRKMGEKNRLQCYQQEVEQEHYAPKRTVPVPVQRTQLPNYSNANYANWPPYESQHYAISSASPPTMRPPPPPRRSSPIPAQRTLPTRPPRLPVGDNSDLSIDFPPLPPAPTFGASTVQSEYCVPPPIDDEEAVTVERALEPRR